MKTFTLLFLLFITPFLMNAQVWDFTGTNDGWATLAATQTTKADYWELTSKDGVNNPGLKLNPVEPAINVSAVSVLAITMKNNSLTGPTEIRSAMTTSSGSIYLSTPITVGDTEYKTYYIDYTGNAKWIGDVSEIKLLFKVSGNTDYVGTGAEVFDIDKVEMLSVIPKTEKYIFNFDTDGDTEAWEAVNATISGPAGGIITFTPTANKYAKFEQHQHYVVADDYNWLRVKVKNNSTDDVEISLITSIARIAFAVTTSDVEEQTYEILLDTIGIGATGVASWTGNAEDLVLRFADGITGKSTGTGTFEINSIEFYHDVGTAIKQNANDAIGVYPNPAKEVLNVANAAGSQISVHDMTGKLVYSRVAVSDNASVNISKLHKGIYFVKVKSATGIKTSKVIVE